MKKYFLLLALAFLYLPAHASGTEEPDWPENTKKTNKVSRKNINKELKGALSGQTTSNPFNKLSNEIILHIISFLDKDDKGFYSFFLTDKRMSSFFVNEMNKRFRSEDFALNITPTLLGRLGQLPAANPRNLLHYSSLFRFNLDKVNTVPIWIDALSEENKYQIKRFACALPSFPSLRKIDFFYRDQRTKNKINLELFFNTLNAQQTKVAHLLSLDFSNVQVMPNAMISMAQALPRFEQLNKLDLGQNEITPQGVRRLANALRNLPKLKELCLDGAYMGDSGVTTMITALFNKNLTTLRHGLESLNLSSNDIHDSGAEKLAKVLPYFPNLKELKLGQNSIGCTGAQSLALELSWCQTLEKLGLQDNVIREDGFLNILQTVNTLPVFQELEFGANDLEADDMEDLKETHAPHATWILNLEEY